MAGRPSPLAECWPLIDGANRFDLGLVLNCAITDIVEPPTTGALGVHHAGLWECDLAQGSLIWSGGVYDLFGLPRGRPVARDEAILHYADDSRVKLERLRSFAIASIMGFSIDVEIRAAAVGERRSMRIIGAPVCEGGTVTRLHGLKLAI